MEKSSLITNILQKAKAVPDGTISKDGLYIKKNNAWVWRDQEERGLKPKDLEKNASYQYRSDEHSSSHAHIHDIHDDGTVSYSTSFTDREMTRVGHGRDIKRMKATDFIKEYLKHHTHAPKTATSFNPTHFSSPEQAEIAAKFVDSIKNRKGSDKLEIPRNLDLDGLPTSANKEVDYWMRKMQSQSGAFSASFDLKDIGKEGVPTNQKNFYRTYLNSEIQRIPPYHTPKDDYKSWRVFDKETLNSTPPRELHDQDLRSRIGNMGEFLKAHPNVSVDPRVLKHPPLDLGDGRFAYLGDYIQERKYTGKGQYIDVVSRITGTINSPQYGLAWKTKNKYSGDGTTQVWAKNYDPVAKPRFKVYDPDSDYDAKYGKDEAKVNNLFPKKGDLK